MIQMILLPVIWNDHHQEWTPQQLDTAASRIHNIAFHQELDQ